MKLLLAIDLEPHLSTEEITEFRGECEAAEIQPEARIAKLIREALAKAATEPAA